MAIRVLRFQRELNVIREFEQKQYNLLRIYVSIVVLKICDTFLYKIKYVVMHVLLLIAKLKCWCMKVRTLQVYHFL